MKFETLDESNFLLFAAKHYDNPQCHDVIEFYDDLQRFKYLKRLFSKYEETGEMKERLVLNHLTVLYNIFGLEATRMLFFKLEGYHKYLKPFLILLNKMPEIVYGIGENGKNIISSDIVMDTKIVQLLRKI